jgi:hypothetical protein
MHDFPIPPKVSSLQHCTVLHLGAECKCGGNINSSVLRGHALAPQMDHNYHHGAHQVKHAHTQLCLNVFSHDLTAVFTWNTLIKNSISGSISFSFPSKLQ